MAWEFSGNSPIYLQLVEHIKMNIMSGEYAAGSRLLSVRELAAEASVNPNTMQKALTELERMQLIYSQRTAGRFITEDTGLISRLKEEMAKQQVKVFFDSMSSLGYGHQESVEMLRQVFEEEQSI